MTAQFGDLLQEPTTEGRTTSELASYLRWLEGRGRACSDYDELWAWSVSDQVGFWGSLWDYFAIRADAPYERVLPEEPRMPGAEWFAGAQLNYVRHALGVGDGDADDDDVAILAYSQTREVQTLSLGELRDQVARARAGLLRLGVRSGDRVAGYLPNIPETVVAFLATASIGAIWSSCAPEFGPRSVIDRFAQISPTVLLAVDGYRYGDRDVDRRSQLAEIRGGLPSVRHLVHVPYLGAAVESAVAWDDLLVEEAPLTPEAVPFDHPLFVLYSSGTTGLPKAIVHSHGGILVEHLKNHGLSWDLRPGDRMMWFTTTAWMMWNALVSALLRRTSLVLVDGNPVTPTCAGSGASSRRPGRRSSA